MAETKMPPWHMWGDSKTVKLIAPAIGQGVSTTSQITRISYKRPETWSFLVYAKIIDYLGAGVANLTVDFNLTIGIGRSVAKLPKWAHMQFGPTAGLPIGSVKFATAVPSPLLDDTLVATPPVVFLDSFPAQDIQVDVDLAYQSATAANAVTVEVTALFAPKGAHVRPEWFKIKDGGAAQFPGGEDSGH